MSRLSFFHPPLSKQKRSQLSRTDIMISRFDTSFVRVFFIIATIACIAVYIILVNHSATSGIRISALETEIARLDQDYKQLLVAKTQAESLTQLRSFSEETGFIPITQRAYVETTENGVALTQE